MKVLLIDDEKELVSTLAERLAIRGIDADWVINAEDALRSVESGPYDVAVVDVKLPRISGIELKRRLQEKDPNIKFIFVTGHGSEDYFKAGSAEAGAEYYLVKPIKIDRLIEKMNEILKD